MFRLNFLKNYTVNFQKIKFDDAHWLYFSENQNQIGSTLFAVSAPQNLSIHKHTLHKYYI